MLPSCSMLNYVIAGCQQRDIVKLTCRKRQLLLYVSSLRENQFFINVVIFSSSFFSIFQICKLWAPNYEFHILIGLAIFNTHAQDAHIAQHSTDHSCCLSFPVSLIPHLIDNFSWSFSLSQ